MSALSDRASRIHMRGFLANIELWLSGIGLVIIGLIPVIIGSPSQATWQLVALIAILLGILHGLIFWLVRRRQRQVRRATIREIQEMLKDRINNQLTVLLINSTLHPGEQLDEAEQLAGMQRAIHSVTTLLDTLSEESLSSWQTRYQKSLDLP